MQTVSRWFTVSNILSLSRVFITPFIVYGMVQRSWNLVFILFFAAALTDILDGYLARLFREPTTMGAWLDSALG